MSTNNDAVPPELIPTITERMKKLTKQDLHNCLMGVLANTPPKLVSGRVRILMYAEEYIRRGGKMSDFGEYDLGALMHRLSSSTVQPSHVEESETIKFETLVAKRWLRTKHNAMNRGIKFDLTLDDMHRMSKTVICHYTGNTLTIGGPCGFSIDRIDHNEGYTRKNTVVCQWWVNLIKSELFEAPSAPLKACSPDQIVETLHRLRILTHPKQSLNYTEFSIDD